MNRFFVSAFALFFSFFSAFASESTVNTTPSGQNALISFLPLVLVFLVFYLFIIRPQQRKTKEFNEMLDNIKIGTKVLTSGGIVGFIKEIDKEKELFTVTISDNISVLVYKKSISNILDQNNDNNKK